MEDEIAARRAIQRGPSPPTAQQWMAATPRATLDLLASFQHAVIRELLTRAAAAAEGIGARALIVSGGVACNTGLRAAAASAGLPYPVYFPSPGLSTDNAAMIAAAAFPKLQRREFAGLAVTADAGLTLA
jgi:N6-L-threonylcarbamoyladenine synthase